MTKLEGATVEVPCNGCQETLRIPGVPHLACQSVSFLCMRCGKITKWKVDSEKAEGARTIPPDQTRLDPDDDGDEDSQKTKKK